MAKQHVRKGRLGKIARKERAKNLDLLRKIDPDNAVHVPSQVWVGWQPVEPFTFWGWVRLW